MVGETCRLNGFWPLESQTVFGRALRSKKGAFDRFADALTMPESGDLFWREEYHSSVFRVLVLLQLSPGKAKLRASRLRMLLLMFYH